MSAFSTVGIYNDLATGEACITVWTTDHEFAGRIDVVFNFFIEKTGFFLPKDVF